MKPCFNHPKHKSPPLYLTVPFSQDGEAEGCLEQIPMLPRREVSFMVFDMGKVCGNVMRGVNLNF
jgi:hypothetical protein